MCPKGVYDRAASKWTPPPLVVDDPEFIEQVRRVYEAGASMVETAQACGTTVKVLQRVMPRYGIERRPAVKREQRGDRNASWRGDSASYSALHLRVEAERGKPQLCVRCHRTDGYTKYEWANLTGRYDDVNDYQRMCVSCHRYYDAARRRLTGERTMPASLRGEGDA